MKTVLTQDNVKTYVTDHQIATAVVENLRVKGALRTWLGSGRLHTVIIIMRYFFRKNDELDQYLVKLFDSNLQSVLFAQQNTP